MTFIAAFVLSQVVLNVSWLTGKFTNWDNPENLGPVACLMPDLASILMPGITNWPVDAS